jgi:hypothetical protein
VRGFYWELVNRIYFDALALGGFQNLLLPMLAAARRALGEGERGQCRLTNCSPLARRIGPGLAFISGRAKPEWEQRRDVPPKPALLLPPALLPRADTLANLQWQTFQAAKAKDRWERRSCAR